MIKVLHWSILSIKEVIFFPTARVQQLTCLLPNCSSPTVHTSSSPLLKSNSSHVFYPTARLQQLTRVQQLTRLLPHCSSPTAHTSSFPLLESNSSHVFFPTARVQQLTFSSPLLSPTAHLKVTRVLSDVVTSLAEAIVHCTQFYPI